MIALHLDATDDAEYNTWRVFSSCFFRLSLYDEDCTSSCPIKNDGHRQQYSFRKTPKIFTQGMSGKSWRDRCSRWLTRHFSNSKLESEIQTGRVQFLSTISIKLLYTLLSNQVLSHNCKSLTMIITA